MITVKNAGQNNGVIVGDNQGIINNITISSSGEKKLPSLLARIIKELGDVCDDEDYGGYNKSLTEFKPDEKIEYNNVKSYKPIIESYSSYYSLCDNMLNTYDNSNISGKAKILRCVNDWYLEEKGNLLASYDDGITPVMEIIKKNSDSLIDAVKKRIYNHIEGSDEFGYKEELEIGLRCFTCYCFMECKILEKPV